mgnify:CR=1 FL=1
MSRKRSKKSSKQSHHPNLKKDLVIAGFGIAIGIFIWQQGLISKLLAIFPNAGLITAFIAGMFFTSIFTGFPALIALLELAKTNPIFLVAALGAAGAVLGDLMIFRFVSNHLSEDVVELLAHQTIWHRLRHVFRSRMMRYSLAIIGGLMIAAPIIPDELAISVLGAAHIKNRYFTAISYTSNFVSISILTSLASPGIFV